MQAGETWQGNLIHPAVERLLALRPRERVLEIACGTGDFARRMAEVGALVLAVDFSEGMLERARAHGGDVEYAYADATQEQELLKLGDEESFDAVVSNMAVMDMESIEPMVAAASRLLRPGGRFVLSILHPAFNSGNVRPTVELDLNGDTTDVYSVKVSAYGQPSTGKGVAVPGSRCSNGISTVRCVVGPKAVLRTIVRPRRARRAAAPSRRREARNARLRLHRVARRAGRSNATHRTLNPLKRLVSSSSCPSRRQVSPAGSDCHATWSGCRPARSRWEAPVRA
jgi:SAM-dependent methyltransferase